MSLQIADLATVLELVRNFDSNRYTVRIVQSRDVDRWTYGINLGPTKTVIEILDKPSGKFISNE